MFNSSKFLPSFYYHDRPVSELESITGSAVDEEEDLPTAVEPPPPVVEKLPVYSTYFTGGMATPAYNSLMLQETKPKPQEPVAAAQLASAPPTAASATSAANKKDEPPSHYQWPAEKDIPAAYSIDEAKEIKYKDSTYVGFQSDVQPVYGRRSHNYEKHVSFEKPEEPTPVKKQLKEGSRLVQQSIKIHEEPQPTAAVVYQQTSSEDYSAVEGDAFRPVLMPHSEYQFGQLNKLVSFADIKL